jgi:hypothetical protein
MCTQVQSNRFDWHIPSQPDTVSSASFHRPEQDLSHLRRTGPRFSENIGAWPIIEDAPLSCTSSERASYHQSSQPRREVEESLRLPPGFRFHPTDEELTGYYLTQKVLNSTAEFQAIGLVDFNRCEPWDLPMKSKMAESILYFFSLRDKKYPTGQRTNRATDAGYWKATGKDREVMTKMTGKLLGMKKTLVFYKGRAPKGEKTNWIMHEYRLKEGELRPDQQEWAVCRVFKKNVSKQKPPSDSSDNNSYGEHPDQHYATSLPALRSTIPCSSGSSASSPEYPYSGLTAVSQLQGDLHNILRLTTNNSNWSNNAAVSTGMPFNGLPMSVRRENGTMADLVPGWELSGELYSQESQMWDVNAGTN